MATTPDDVTQATNVLSLMNQMDAATHTFRMNTINEIAQMAAIKLLVEGQMNTTQWAALTAEINNLQSVSDTVVSALSQAAAIKANAVPSDAASAAVTTLKTLSTNLLAAVAQFTVAQAATSTTPPSGTPSTTPPTMGS